LCVNREYLRVNVVDSNEQNMERRRERERIFKDKPTFVEIQSDVLWAGRHKLFVSFGVSFTLFWLLTGEEFRDCTVHGSEPVQ